MSIVARGPLVSDTAVVQNMQKVNIVDPDHKQLDLGLHYLLGRICPITSIQTEWSCCKI